MECYFESSVLDTVWFFTRRYKIHARVASDSRSAEIPVVLVHGLGMSSRYMAPLGRHLAADFLVFAPDLPGFGLSEKPSHSLTVAELADALSEFLDAAGLTRANFVGNSLGCEILVEFARRHPDRTHKLVLQGPTPDPEERSTPAKVLLFLVTAFFERWSIIWVAMGDYLRCGISRYVSTFRSMVDHRIAEKLPCVTAPALVVWGTRDFVISRDAVRKVADLLPNGRLIVVDGAAHGMNYSHPREFAQAILPFLHSAGGPYAD